MWRERVMSKWTESKRKGEGRKRGKNVYFILFQVNSMGVPILYSFYIIN